MYEVCSFTFFLLCYYFCLLIKNESWDSSRTHAGILTYLSLNWNITLAELSAYGVSQEKQAQTSTEKVPIQLFILITESFFPLALLFQMTHRKLSVQMILCCSIPKPQNTVCSVDQSTGSGCCLQLFFCLYNDK